MKQNLPKDVAMLVVAYVLPPLLLEAAAEPSSYFYEPGPG
jgi:hypothetical protein